MQPEEWGNKVVDLRWQHRLNQSAEIRTKNRLLEVLRERAVMMRSDAIDVLRQIHLDHLREDEELREAMAGGYNVVEESPGLYRILEDRFGSYTHKGALRKIRKALRKAKGKRRDTSEAGA